MNRVVPIAFGATYVVQLWIKAALALRKRIQEPVPSAVDPYHLTLVQPVTSGDETLADNLLANVRELPRARFIWVVDRSDNAARDICRQSAEQHPAADIRVIETDEPPPGHNPKLWKQAAALPLVHTALVAVIDDDTRVPRRAIDSMFTALNAGADLATGLPCYVPARGRWSSLVAEFVNSAAILTYLSAAQCAAPRSINGMCYMLRTDYVRSTHLFSTTARAITDDLAIACEVRRLGGRIAQTAEPHFIRTTVLSLVHYRRLMHRWFVFIRLLVQRESPEVRAVVGLAYGLHPLLLLSLIAMGAIYFRVALLPLIVVLAVRSVTIAWVNVKLTGKPRHSPLASLIPELLQPVFFAVASVNPVIWWRRRRIRVRAFDDFEYLSE